MKKTLNEFKKFAMRGNVVDMAVSLSVVHSERLYPRW